MGLTGRERSVSDSTLWQEDRRVGTLHLPDSYMSYPLSRDKIPLAPLEVEYH
jgi:hypothetical protein